MLIQRANVRRCLIKAITLFFGMWTLRVLSHGCLISVLDPSNSGSAHWLKTSLHAHGLDKYIWNKCIWFLEACFYFWQLEKSDNLMGALWDNDLRCHCKLRLSHSEDTTLGSEDFFTLGKIEIQNFLNKFLKSLFSVACLGCGQIKRSEEWRISEELVQN